jgi:hypothetical protein
VIECVVPQVNKYDRNGPGLTRSACPPDGQDIGAPTGWASLDTHRPPSCPQHTSFSNSKPSETAPAGAIVSPMLDELDDGHWVAIAAYLASK